MTTTDKNRIIAQFMGLRPKLESPDVYSFSDSPWFVTRGSDPEKIMDDIANYAKYHSDWNWLMEVVEKIQLIPSYDKDRFGTIVKIEGRNCSIKSDNYGDKDKNYSKSIYFNGSYSGNTKIEAVHEAVYQFVVWHNQNKK